MAEMTVQKWADSFVGLPLEDKDGEQIGMIESAVADAEGRITVTTDVTNRDGLDPIPLFGGVMFKVTANSIEPIDPAAHLDIGVNDV